ncbi:MAG: SRPBCC family protein [Thermomicrobiales bacterium]|nr:SRPBCC family protein [Thermomicrobiales bacterium]
MSTTLSPTNSRLSDTEYVMERTFAAPPERVFEAYTTPSLLAQWWGQRQNSTTVLELDARPGGHWRFIQRDPAGVAYEFFGEYLEVSPARLVNTFEFAGFPGHVVTDAVTFQPEGAGTRVVATSTFASKEDLDGMLASGMESGATESWDRLAELLAR